MVVLDMRLTRFGAVAAMCGGALAIASTYLVAWGVWTAKPLKTFGFGGWSVLTQWLGKGGGSDSLARFSEFTGGWLGAATAIAVGGGALLVGAGALWLLFPRSRSICGVASGVGSLAILLAAVEAVGLPSRAFALGPAIWLCLVGAVAGAFSAVVALSPVCGRPRQSRSQLPVGGIASA